MQGAQAARAGVVKFHSKDEVRRYLKSLVEQYADESEGLGDYLGGLLRTLEQSKGVAKAPPKEQKDSKNKDKVQAAKTTTRGWLKMGNLLVNIGDPTGAMAEVLFQLHEDVKARLAKSTEALKSFDELSSQTLPATGTYFLQLRNGAPEKLVADSSAAPRENFSFTADFKLV